MRIVAADAVELRCEIGAARRVRVLGIGSVTEVNCNDVVTTPVRNRGVGGGVGGSPEPSEVSTGAPVYRRFVGSGGYRGVIGADMVAGKGRTLVAVQTGRALVRAS